MDLMLLRVFQSQVDLQCDAVLLSAQELDAWANRDAMPAETMPHIWTSVQGLLTGAANLSKAFWGQRGEFTEQRTPLRDSLSVGDTSPLRDVNMRNHFEHFDERLDRWWDTSQNHNHLDQMVGPPEMVGGMDEKDMFRVYDPVTGHLVFWGERFNLREIVAEVARIKSLVTVEAAKPHWEP